MKRDANANIEDDVIKIILAEYTELRAELMFFIAEQRKSTSIMSTVIAGQLLFLLNTENLNYTILAYSYLYIIPLVIFLLMLRTLDCTSKIILIADYIHKGIKAQLKARTTDDPIFFEWEEHKGKTLRLSRKISAALDYSKWWVFGLGILSPFVLGVWFMILSLKINYYGIGAALILNISWAAISIGVARTFNEIEGESKQA